MKQTEQTDLALRVQNLKKQYKSGTQALKGINLEVKEGQFIGLLGPNGAGKSTLIHSIMGLVIPTSGTAEVFGRDVVKDYQEARKLCGLAPQEPNLDWFLTVEETLDFHGGYYGMSRAERKERIDELLEAFSLTDKRKTSSRALSGGMKRRVVLARALMHKPKLIILDEPTAGVDVELRLELWHYMQKVNNDGTTILLTTHYIEEAEQLCNQIALINKGEILDEGTPEDLKKRFKKKTLEDVYLAATGREELSRKGIS
jgi:ABC-2 type transport system ATP-binding protein